MKFKPIRKLMFSWWLLRRGLTLGVRALVFDPDGKVLLVKHSYVRGWHLPGGGVERGETVQLALTRELEEEAGIIATQPPELHGIFRNGEIFAGDHVVVFVVRAFTQVTPSGSELEIIDRGFFDCAALPEGTSMATKRRLDEVLNRSAPSETW